LIVNSNKIKANENLKRTKVFISFEEGEDLQEFIIDLQNKN